MFTNPIMGITLYLKIIRQVVRHSKKHQFINELPNISTKF